VAKKKKHKIRKKKQNKVVKNTTINKLVHPEAEDVHQEDLVAEKTRQDKNDASTSVDKSVLSDVKFSLLLLGVIIATFVLLYIILQNKSISDQVYGIIKINF